MKNIYFILLLSLAVQVSSQVNKDSIYNPPESFPPLRSTPASESEAPFKHEYKQGVMYYIRTNLDLSYKGFIIKETEYYIIIEDRATHDTHEIRKGEIKSAKIISDRQNYLDYAGENYHADNYMLSSSTFLFKRETFTVNYHWFLLENIDYAITENWSVGASSLAFYPVSIGTKFSFKVDETNYVGGHIFGIGNISTENSDFFVAYGAIVKFTRGTSNRNLSLSGGLLGINSSFLFSTPSPEAFYNMYFGNAAYCTRLNEYVALNLEGWYLPQAELGLAGAAIKLVRTEESAWTFGCFSVLNLLNSNITLNFKALPIPYLGFTQKF